MSLLNPSTVAGHSRSSDMGCVSVAAGAVCYGNTEQVTYLRKLEEVAQRSCLLKGDSKRGIFRDKEINY